MKSKGGTSKSILVVDDEADVILGLRAVLEADGHQVLSASDGAEALEILERHRPDLVILDILMPGLDGWETLRRMQSNDRLREIPVLMLTVLDKAHEVKIGIDLGCTWYYTKPITDYDDFRLVVQRLLVSLESVGPPSDEIHVW